jgi:hypothetical protein
MSKKLYAVLLPVLAVAAMAMTAGSAQAAFHWYVCEKHAGTGPKFNNDACTASGTTNEWEYVRLPFESGGKVTKTMVDTFGTLTLSAPAVPVKIKCNVIDAGKIWNVTELTQGKDEITAFVNFECVTEEGTCPEPTIVANNLPWQTELAAGPVDKIKGVDVTLFCAKVEAARFNKGELMPTLTNPTVSDPLLATFTTGTGELESGTKVKAKVTGSDRIVGFAHGENIAVKEP